MALGKCRECGREVSKSAKTCPGCGVAKPVVETSWVRIAGGVIAVIIAVRVCGHTSETTTPAAAAVAANVPAAPGAQTTQAAQPVQAAEPPKPVKLDKLAASTLVQAYSANEIAADAKYKGKRFKVTGTVVAVKSDITDDPQVWLVSELNGVIASGLGKSFAATLNKGDAMTASCTVTGSVIGSPTIDCSGPQSP